MAYKNIVIGVELIEDSDQGIITKASEIIRNKEEIKLTLVHAIEHMRGYGAAYGVAVGAEIEEVLYKNAEESMRKLGAILNVPKERQIIKFGPAKTLVLDEANQSSADLIVVGSHGRHGLRLLIGSTANAILHGAKCDVLAVRLK